jgi:CDP-diacylglycerol--glycerol-3-phosphate 3-phosphatidyltransferase
MRAVLVGPLLWSLHRDGQGVSLLTAALLGLATGSDLVDGWLARRLGQTSRLGRILDPLADKVLLGGLAVGLLMWRSYPMWLVGLLLVRDGAIVAIGLVFLRRRALVIAASALGKASTVVLSITAVAWVLPFPDLLRQSLAMGAGALLVLSGLGYARTAWRLATADTPRQNAA